MRPPRHWKSHESTHTHRPIHTCKPHLSPPPDPPCPRLSLSIARSRARGTRRPATHSSACPLDHACAGRSSSTHLPACLASAPSLLTTAASTARSSSRASASDATWRRCSETACSQPCDGTYAAIWPDPLPLPIAKDLVGSGPLANVVEANCGQQRAAASAG